MIEISHLVVDGCSLTYCQGLENPHIDGWPALLAQKINVPVVNLALPGASNDAIHRRQYDYFFRSKNFYKLNALEAKPFHIISLTFAGRREEFFERYYNSMEHNRHFTLDLSPDLDKLLKIIKSEDTSLQNIPAYVEYAYFLNMNYFVAETKKMEQWASLVNLFQNNKINYCIGDYIPTQDKSTIFKLKTEFGAMYNFLYSDKNYYGKFSQLTNHLPTLPCGHDDIEAQKIIADHIYNKIIEQYREIVPKPISKLYNLRDYYKNQKQQQYMHFSKWYENS
jgi:hypothetical protein